MANIYIYVIPEQEQWLCIDKRFGKVFYIPNMEEDKIYHYVQKRYPYTFANVILCFREE